MRSNGNEDAEAAEERKLAESCTSEFCGLFSEIGGERKERGRELEGHKNLPYINSCIAVPTSLIQVMQPLRMALPLRWFASASCCFLTLRTLQNTECMYVVKLHHFERVRSSQQRTCQTDHHTLKMNWRHADLIRLSLSTFRTVPTCYSKNLNPSSVGVR